MASQLLVVTLANVFTCDCEVVADGLAADEVQAVNLDVGEALLLVPRDHRHVVVTMYSNCKRSFQQGLTPRSAAGVRPLRRARPLHLVVRRLPHHLGSHSLIWLTCAATSVHSSLRFAHTCVARKRLVNGLPSVTPLHFDTTMATAASP